MVDYQDKQQVRLTPIAGYACMGIVFADFGEGGPPKQFELASY